MAWDHFLLKQPPLEILTTSLSLDALFGGVGYFICVGWTPHDFRGFI